MLKGEEGRYRENLPEGGPGPLCWNPKDTRSPGYMSPVVKDAMDKTAARREKLESQLDHIHEVMMKQEGAENMLKLAQAQQIIADTIPKIR